MNQQLLDNIEKLIDCEGVNGVLIAIAKVCDEKSNHISENWQDYHLASQWANIGFAALQLSEKKIPV